MPERFFCPRLLQDPLIRLEGGEAHHLSRVLRKSVDDEIELFDGNGGVALGEIVSIAKKSVEIRVAKMTQESEPISTLTIATAVPKADRYRWLVEKCTELGVSRLIPLITERSVVKPGAGKQGKMEQVVVEACKQSRRNWLMEIAPPQPLEDVLKSFSEQGTFRIMADPAGSPLHEILPADLPKSICCLIGPEGGFTDDEVEKSTNSGFLPISLGKNILRIETAAVATASILSAITPQPAAKGDFMQAN